MALGVCTLEELHEVVEAYRNFEEFAFDVETCGAHRLDPHRNQVFWISLAGPGRCDVIPCGHPVGEPVLYPEGDDLHRILKNGKHQERRTNPASGKMKWFNLPWEARFTKPPSQLWVSDVVRTLRPLFFSGQKIVGHNVKFDLRSLGKYFGALPPGPYVDTMVAARLINENHHSYGLSDCVKRSFRVQLDKTITKEVERHPYSVAYEYSYLDAKYTWLLWQRLKTGLVREKVRHIFDLEMKLIPILVNMEETGVLIDEPVLDEIGEEFELGMARIQIDLNKVAGRELNLNANRQVAHLVYDILEHKCEKKTPTGERSVAKGVLEEFLPDPHIDQLLQHAQLAKLHGTFVQGLKEKIDGGCIHPDFKQVGTRTGRLSCSTPNLQQIPSRSELGKRVRSVFIARPGHTLVVADLSQIELRVLAHFTQDPQLLDAYRLGLDLHAITAKGVFGPDFTPLHRSLAKNGNFSIVFGAGPSTLVTRYGFPSIAVARKVLEGFYDTYRAYEPWRKKTLAQAKQMPKPVIETILKRRRHLPGLHSLDRGEYFAAERQAISTKIQGTAADFFKLAMIEVDRQLGELSWEARPLMTIHDELVVEVPTSHAEEGLNIVKTCLEGVTHPDTGEPLLSVPVVADAKLVERWSDAKD